MTFKLKNNRAPLICHIKFCASFQRHMWIQTGVTFRKTLNWVLTSGTLTFDRWHWPFAWTSLLSMLITLKFHDDTMMWKRRDGQTDRQTDRQRQTNWTIHRARCLGAAKKIPSRLRVNVASVSGCTCACINTRRSVVGVTFCQFPPFRLFLNFSALL